MNQILLPGDRKKRTAGCDRFRQWLSTISLLVGLLAPLSRTPVFTGQDRERNNFSLTTKLSGEAIMPIVSSEQQVQAFVTLQISY